MFDIPDNIKALIFDLDGTLADTMPVHLEAWSAAGQEFGVEITPYMINAMAGVPTIQSVVKLNEIYGWDLEPLEVKRYKDMHFRSLKMQKGSHTAIEPVLDIARKHLNVIPMAIGTGASRLNALETLRDLKIIDWFDAVVSADDIENYKPFPDTFLKCAEIMQVDPKHCLVFEDGELGVLAAKNAEMQVIDVRNFI